MSNIQALSHINNFKTLQIINLLKKEFASGLNLNKIDETTSVNSQILCKNELTGVKYDFQKGSHEECDLYRVMPLDGVEKIYFDSKDEYEVWSHKKKRFI